MERILWRSFESCKGIDSWHTRSDTFGKEEVFTAAEVATAIKGIKPGKAASEDETRPEMLEALTGEGILWLMRVCQVAWKFGKTLRDWQTGVIISVFKKGDRKQSANYRGISLLSLPGKVYAKCLKRKCREIVESNLEDGQCGFRASRSSTNQIFTLKQIFEKSWEYGKDLFACFVNLEKAYDRVPRDKLWKVLREYGVDGQLLRSIKSFYCRPKVCVRVNGQAIKVVWCGRCTVARVRFVSFSLFTWIGSTNAAKLRSVPRLEIAKSVVCYSRMIWFCSQNLASSAH